jgi:hypothetical protein
MEKYKHIQVYDNIRWSEPFVPDENLRVTSIPDMVMKVLSVTEGYNNWLYIGGPGSNNYQSVGAQGGADPHGNMSLQVDPSDPLKLKGFAALWLPLLGSRIKHVWLQGLDEENKRSPMLCTAVSRALGIGTRVDGYNSTTIWYGDRTGPVRRPTHSATLDRDALRARLLEYTR